MKENIAALLRKAEKSIEAAEVLKEKGIFSFATSRAYFAMFYVAEAFLLSKSLTFSKHSGVISAFGEHFARARLIDPKFHRYLIEASEKRHISDYEILEEIGEETAETTIKRAREFLEVAKIFFSGE